MEPISLDAFKLLKILSEQLTPSGLHWHVPLDKVPADLRRSSLLELLRGQGRIWVGRAGAVSASYEDPVADAEAFREGIVIGWVADEGDIAHILENEMHVPDGQKLHLRLTDAGRLALAEEDEADPILEPNTDEADALRILAKVEAVSKSSRISASKVSSRDPKRRDLANALQTLKCPELVESISSGRAGGYWMTLRGAKALQQLPTEYRK